MPFSFLNPLDCYAKPVPQHVCKWKNRKTPRKQWKTRPRGDELLTERPPRAVDPLTNRQKTDAQRAFLQEVWVLEPRFNHHGGDVVSQLTAADMFADCPVEAV